MGKRVQTILLVMAPLLQENHRVPQRKETDPALWESIKMKLSTVRSRKYIFSGPVILLTSYFPVPKGDSNIRIVYDGTKSGLNECLWAPWFPLTTIETHLQAIESSSYMGDRHRWDVFELHVTPKNVTICRNRSNPLLWGWIAQLRRIFISHLGEVETMYNEFQTITLSVHTRHPDGWRVH